MITKEELEKLWKECNWFKKLCIILFFSIAVGLYKIFKKLN